MIPKLIIQTGPAEIPLLLRSAMLTVKMLHPTFEYIFFDDRQIEDFLQTHFPQHRSAYHSFPFRIQRYDFFRYLAVHHYGGFYLDLDVFLVKDLACLLDQRCVFPFEELTFLEYFRQQHQMDWQIGNYAFGAEPGHPLLGAIIENCVRAQADPSWVKPMMQGVPRLFRDEFYVLNTTGPGVVSRTWAECRQLASGVTILFPSDVRDPRSWHQVGNYGVHWMASSWRDRPQFWLRLLRKPWDMWTLHRIRQDSKNRARTRDIPNSKDIVPASLPGPITAK